MILKTDFQRSGARDLLKYIRRDRETDRQKVPLRDRTGRALPEEQIEQFVKKSERFGFQRHFIVSPHPDAQFSPQAVGENTREFMEDAFGRQPTTDYVYAIHEDSEIVHSHVAATGTEPELQMAKDDLERLRDRAREVFREPDRLKERAPERASAITSDAAHDQARDSDLAETTDSDSTVVEESEREVTPDRDFDRGGGR
ncbi:relaxase/mobilization nuclease domain-containing protein [Haloarcula sp. JP-L23]|uniref:relaxase/mobilization nuclease domain-containing protein n=1 Tax=Haloarcula sp. JP-L23 TaxID=2716717 RepID=UPI00140EB392|nr:relaxase/mobilization nuclease domain-containing protein [Haloarcula sp. JP-L23]